MCQGLFVGYRLELVAIGIFLHEGTLKIVVVGEKVNSRSSAGDSARVRFSIFSFLEAMC